MISIAKFTQNQWQEVAVIYKEGIDTKNATFRTEVPSWEEWNASHHQHSRFVAVEENKVVGWCAIAPVSKRFEYRGVAEVSVYVKQGVVGKGIGSLLMEAVIGSSENNGIWTLYSSLFPENIGSEKLHVKYDFRKIGYREKIAQLDGVWRDTVLYERRSKKQQLL
ncbi:GNAT family N-acetyltransferase [Tenacibaculum caenipelagi]|uniref:Phosphinothricin acetyltransferase n=1 Tax=Tenacibaculum caenipelagi TaxID=1325435 RepID=A0A4R6TI81_9FLAO|nr:GNAT family N-acetyltransferase [Tenacibaculum caenipelagi]TDQ30086.1 phosphinothricin acetyltransferase [Tenacibaculum caenipelagi]